MNTSPFNVFDINSDRAVSPVVGVILMVAIVVILSAVIGSAVINIGGNVNENAQAGVSIEQNSDGVTVTWLDNQNAETLEVLVDGEAPNGTNTLDSVGDSLTVATNESATVSVVGTTSSGSTTTIQSETATQDTLVDGETEPQVVDSPGSTDGGSETAATLFDVNTQTEWEDATNGTDGNLDTGASVSSGQLTLDDTTHSGNSSVAYAGQFNASGYDTVNVTVNTSTLSTGSYDVMLMRTDDIGSDVYFGTTSVSNTGETTFTVDLTTAMGSSYSGSYDGMTLQIATPGDTADQVVDINNATVTEA